uniref:Fungal STAND N-terminal Goodbye domain-containing protein n=1 Tax=Coccidioides posadasii RMSCC 3488 TaxID=454284 RepID=A0A0J6FF95_COCPO|nr:hypothetical protein CPAG_04293 [Coccidioides posadasii RMSCC 3488]
MGSPENPGEEDLDQMWNEAQIEFQKIRGGIRNHSPSLEWMKSLQKLARKKKLMKKRNLGSLAADAASNAFGPSTLCFNAVSYLITPAQNYSKIFDGVADLFERIPAFLDGFEVYARSKTIGVQIDLHLRRIIHELLRSFIRICALSIKISKHSKVL